MKKITLFALLLHCCICLSAQVTYTFAGNGNWSDSSNWIGNIKPPTPILPNTTINIIPVISGQCVLDVPVTVPFTATLNVWPNRRFLIAGNLMVLSGNNKLKKELMLFSNASGGYDTSGAMIYHYDDLDRLSIAIDCNFGNNTFDTTDNRYFRYYYNGTDTLPYKRTLSYYPDGYYNDTNFYTYTSAGRLAYDSGLSYANPPLVPGVSATAREFYYSGDSIILLTRKYSNRVFVGTLAKYTYQRSVNGNLVYQRDSMFSSIAEITTGYSDARNPFYHAMRCGRRGIIESEIVGWEWQDAPMNLMTSRHKTSIAINTAQTDLNVSYVLDIYGYPVEANVTTSTGTAGSSPSGESYKVMYIYE